MSLRVMIYDATCRTSRVRRRTLPVGLSHSWIAGAWLYKAMRRFDHVRGFSAWPDALAWLAELEPDAPISEIQFWGHGRWGRALIDGAPLGRRALESGHRLNGPLRDIRARLSGKDALWWFRTCETFGARRGHDFARAWTDFMGCRAAGHTYVIGPWQSGLHALDPGATPHWSASEGLARGTPEVPRKALYSGRKQPFTIHCLRGDVPSGW